MSDLIPVEKDLENQKKIPTVWRSTFVEIVDAIKDNNYRLSRGIALSEDVAKSIKENIEDYGVTLVSLPEDSWNSSACQWIEDYWDVLIDLYSKAGLTDLVLSVRVREFSGSYSFTVHSVHVP